MNSKLLLSITLLALALPLSAQDVQTRLGDVKDSRTTGQFFAELEVEVKLSGDALEDAQSRRILLTSATDDTGRSLIEKNKTKTSEDFESLSNFGQKNSITLKLKNPARKAATVKEITGTLELFVPKRDPESIVAVASFEKKTGAPIEAPALQKANVKLTAWNKAQFDAMRAKQKAAEAKKPKNLGDAIGSAFGEMFGFGNLNDNDIAIQVDDPDKKLVEVEFQDAGGKKLETQGRSSSTSNKVTTMVYSLRSQLPENAKLIIYLSTPKAVVQVPLALKDVPLP